MGASCSRCRKEVAPPPYELFAPQAWEQSEARRQAELAPLLHRFRWRPEHTERASGYVYLWGDRCPLSAPKAQLGALTQPWEQRGYQVRGLYKGERVLLAICWDPSAAPEIRPGLKEHIWAGQPVSHSVRV